MPSVVGLVWAHPNLLPCEGSWGSEIQNSPMSSGSICLLDSQGKMDQMSWLRLYTKAVVELEPIKLKLSI